MKSEWMTHKGRRFVYQDFRSFGIDAEGLRAELEAVDRLISRQTQNSVLALADLRDTVASRKVVEMFKESAAQTKTQIRKQAVVGVTGIKRLLAEAVARFAQQPLALFDTVEEAKEWLVSDKEDAMTMIKVD